MTAKIIDTLAGKHVQPTPMRMLILEQLLLNTRALSLVDLEGFLPRADRSTIYRNLKFFVQKGLIHTVDEGSVAQHYALCPDACEEGAHLDAHPHFYCISCKETVCLSSLVIPSFRFPAKYRVEQVEMTAKGICPTCL